MKNTRHILALAIPLLLSSTAAESAQTEQQDFTRALWTEADHPSGIYYAKAKGSLQIVIENQSPDAQPLDGSIDFGPSVRPGEEFKPVSITPIAATTIGGRERAKIPLEVAFAAAGPYELRWVRADKSFTTVENQSGVSLQAIFAPRVGGASHWITTLPRQAPRVPGYLTDLIAQTTVRQFVLDERFAFDPATNIGLGIGASLGVSSEQAHTLFDEMNKAKAATVLRITVPITNGASPKLLTGFRRYIADAATRMKGSLKAIVIAPDQTDIAALTAQQRLAYREFYLAGYDEAKRHDKTISLLGAGDASTTRSLLLATVPPAKAESLGAYIDALAITDVSHQPAIARQIQGQKKWPVWILPPNSEDPWPFVPTAAALAEEAVAIPLPPPSVDRGVTAHLLGGAVFFQSVHPKNPPFVATFQGDGYAVAAVAGFGASTPLDALYPALARTRSAVSPTIDDEKPTDPSIELPDDTRSMRVVDSAGSPVDCRSGDILFVPAGDRMVYVLQTGSAEDLAALLRPAPAHRLPLIEISATVTVDAEKKFAATLRLTNIHRDEVAGAIKLIVPPSAEQKTAIVLGEADLPPLASEKSVEITIPLAADPPTTPVIAELTTRRTLQRTAIILSKAAPKSPETQP